MDDYCYAKMATSCQRQHKRQPETSSKSPTEIKTKTTENYVQQLIGHPEELPPPSGGSSTLKQETPQPPCIKKEEEELWITQEGECLLGQLDYTKLPLTIVSVKIEDDGEKPQVDNLLLSDGETEDEVGVPLSSDTDSEDVHQLIGHPQPPHIKKEVEELWITQEGGYLLEPQEADLTKLPLTVVSVKTEDDEEKPQPIKLLAPLSDSEAEDEVEEPLSSDTDCEGDMRTHTDKHSGCSKRKSEKKCLSCSVCAKSFNRKSNLTQHMVTHRGEKSYNCSVCSKSFSRKGNLTQHMKTHAEKHFCCSVCDKRFFFRQNLTRHVTRHKVGKPFNCSVGGKKVRKKCDSTQHTSTDTSEKTFNCSDCGQMFPQKSNLTDHMRTHTGEKPFDCSVCGKSFSQKSHLTQHTRTHTGEKPFDCSVCHESFSQKSSLNDHVRTHSGEKPLICSFCSKCFISRQGLTQHIMKHTGKDKCSVCSKSFPKESSMHTGERPFNCSVCANNFSHKSSLT
ncbi:zinc finger protein OZF-like isoform X2 [Nerophis ophidion]|uniref:zinc finger protein OZF-like isoform X2 n=1 Tax=Nerophis ophidion TaxID=159077 RepID=UPI002ADF51D2|nr:zinc finger protein OZF-like isoform X2 [Nerophis ophidion]